jgi:predicted Zn-dependent protease
VSIPLAEFWLRQKTNLDKALEAFKGALRQGPDQSRWVMRIAQTYLAKGWKKEGLKLLKNALADPDLDPELQREGSVLLNDLGDQMDGSP